MKMKLKDVFLEQLTGEWGTECDDNNGTKILRTTNFTPIGVINFNDVVIRTIDRKKVEKKRLHEGDIILEKSGGTEKTPVGRVVYCDEKIENDIFLCNNFTQAMRVNTKLAVPRYIFYLMWNFHVSGRTDLLQNKTTGIRNLQVKAYLDTEVIIPIHDVQMQIVSKLDKIAQLIEKRKQQLEKLDMLVKSQFIEMFGDPVLNPKGWNICTLESLATKISDGVHAKPQYTTSGKPFVSVTNMNQGVLDFTNCKYVSVEDYNKMIKTTFPQKGDVLYTKVGATYGIPAYIDTDQQFCLYVSVCLIKPKHDLIDARFLTESLRMPYIKKQADDRIKGIGVPDLHLKEIKAFHVICPPMDMQHQFTEFVQQADKSKFAIQQSLEKLETLKKSLMQEYFG